VGIGLAPATGEVAGAVVGELGTGVLYTTAVANAPESGVGVAESAVAVEPSPDAPMPPPHAD